MIYDFNEVIEDVVGEALISNYVFIVEVMTETGMDLRVVTSDTMSPWHAVGMLQVASEMIHTDTEVRDEQE
jgi:hypothetical protein